jgi:hypothetical protein
MILNKWVEWFAWYPVVIGDRVVWLKTVERSLVTVCDIYGNRSFNFEYRLK